MCPVGFDNKGVRLFSLLNRGGVPIHAPLYTFANNYNSYICILIEVIVSGVEGLHTLIGRGSLLRGECV